MNILIALLIWLLSTVTPPPDTALTAYGGVKQAAPVIIAVTVDTSQTEAVLGQNEVTHTRPPGVICHGEGCYTPEVPIVWDVECQAEFCHEDTPPGWERVPERP